MMSSSRKCVLIATLVLACINLRAQITSTFNSNAEGWTTPNDADGTIAYSATGGNPGGFVLGTPLFFNLGATTIYAPFYFVAPGTYLGNRSAYYNGVLQYDIQQSTAGTPNQYAEVIIANSLGITLYYFPPVSNQPLIPTNWSTFSVTLNNASGFWKTTNSSTGLAATEAQVQSVLTDLANLQIRGLYRDANTINRLDNVSFRQPISITTQPSSFDVCAGPTLTLTTLAANNPNLSYQWQREITPGVWSNVTNTSVYSGAGTATLSVNTAGNSGAGNYRCKISGTAVNDVFTNTATIKVNSLPAAPTATGNASCGPDAITLTAVGGSVGQYRWYTVATNGTAIAGQTSDTYKTPSITSTKTYYVAIDNGTCESTRTSVVATVNTIPTAPTATGNSSCGSAAITLNATGASAGQYRWYSVPTNGTAIAGQTNSAYKTPVITSTKTYYAAINDGTCESTRTPAVATVNPVPTAPTATGNSSCGPAAITLNAAGASAGQYRWYTVSTNGTALAGQTNNTYKTPVLANTTTYYVAVNNGTCQSTRTPVVATIDTIPEAPTATGNSACIADAITLRAAGANAGQYRWYTESTGGTAIAGETNDTYKTPVIDKTTTYYVAINNGSCESTRTSVVAAIGGDDFKATITQIDNTLMASTGGTYQWFLSGKPISEATNQSLEINLYESGFYTVKIMQGICTALSDEFIYLITATENNANSVKLYPNPVIEDLTVELPQNVSTTISIVDMLGQEQISMSNINNGGVQTIPFKTLQSGTYMLILQSAQAKSYYKIVKQ